MKNSFFQTLLTSLGVQHTSEYTNTMFENQPFADTLFGLSIMLKKYKVPNECVRLTDKEEFLQQESKPFVAIYNGQFKIISFENDKVAIQDAQGRKFKINKDEFSKNWDGVALIPYPDAESQEPDYNRHRAYSRVRRFKEFGLMAVLVFMAVLAIASNGFVDSLMWWCVLSIDILGTGVCFMLLQKELHISNRFADRLCGLAKESHCEDVTNSDGGTIFGLFKLSEIGFTYFAVNTLFLLLYPASISVIAITAAVVLPFTFWSLWYQKFKVKSWCVLCLCSLAAMWLQATAFFAGGQYSHLSITWESTLWLLSAYGLMILALDKVMEYIREYKMLKVIRRNYNRLKYDSKVIDAFMDEESRFDVSPEACSSIIFGNPEADTQIIVFSNPYCGPCAAMHEHIKDLSGKDIAIKYIFTAFTEEKAEINKYIIAAYQKYGADRTWQLLTDWYTGGKEAGKEFFAEMARKGARVGNPLSGGMALDIDTPEVAAEFNKHKAWARDPRLMGTPTILVNGKALQSPYTIDDYVYIA